MNRSQLLRRLSQGAVLNVGFSDFIDLVEAFGFHLARRRGSRHINAHDETKELINVQEVAGEAKPYQIRQFLSARRAL